MSASPLSKNAPETMPKFVFDDGDVGSVDDPVPIDVAGPQVEHSHIRNPNGVFHFNIVD